MSLLMSVNVSDTNCVALGEVMLQKSPSFFPSFCCCCCFSCSSCCCCCCFWICCNSNCCCRSCCCNEDTLKLRSAVVTPCETDWISPDASTMSLLADSISFSSARWSVVPAILLDAEGKPWQLSVHSASSSSSSSSCRSLFACAELWPPYWAAYPSSSSSSSPRHAASSRTFISNTSAGSESESESEPASISSFDATTF